MPVHDMDAPSVEEPSGTNGSDIQAVGRVAAILELFGPHRPMVTVAEGAKLLGLNRTTISRYFSSLVSAGLLERNPDQPTAFEPAQTLLQLGAFALGRRDVVSVAPTVMRELSNTTRLASVLSIWGVSGPVVVHTEQHLQWGAQVTVRTGTQLPLKSAQAVVFLAYSKDPLSTGRLLATLDAEEADWLRDRVTDAQHEGLSRRKAANGITAIAAPVFDLGGVCASIALLGTAETLPTDTDSREVELLRSAAADLTTTLGGAMPKSSPDTQEEVR